MERILCIMAELNAGGAETFMMKLFRNIDKEKFVFDFCSQSSIHGIYEEEIKSLGGKVYHIPPKTKNIIKNFLLIRKLVKENKYKYVIRPGNHALSTLELIAAKLGGAKVLAMRATSASTGSKKSLAVHKLFCFLTKVVPNVKIAPSAKASLFVFGKKQTNAGKVHILKNGIDAGQYVFSEEKRKKVRSQFGIQENAFVIGHVGRFTKVKNHTFIVNVFSEILKMQPHAVLLLVGTGELQEEIKEKVKELGIENNVLFAGHRKDVAEILSAFDTLIFPSIYEGMPNVVIEAQTAGLKCFVSDSITKEVDITGLVTFLSIEGKAAGWAEEILENKDYDRKDMTFAVQNAGYDIKAVTNEFVELLKNAEKDLLK